MPSGPLVEKGYAMAPERYEEARQTIIGVLEEKFEGYDFAEGSVEDAAIAACLGEIHDFKLLLGMYDHFMPETQQHLGVIASTVYGMLDDSIGDDGVNLVLSTVEEENLID